MAILKTLIFILLTLTTLGCMNTNSRQKRIKRSAVPEQYFEGDDLRMARAIYNSDTKTIESLIKHEHYDVNKRGYILSSHDNKPTRYTYLGYAVKIGEVKAAEKLLELGANPDRVNDEGALWANINLACDHKNKDMIRLLVKYKENLNPALTRSPIGNLIIVDADKDLIDLLLANGANINYQSYIGGGTVVSTALGLGKFDYVNYFLGKGADPTIIEYSGSSIALEIQSEIADGRLSDYGLKEYTQLKNRLITQYHVKFPVKREYRKGQEACIKRYENLSQVDKDFLGKAEADRIKQYKENLLKNTTILGQDIDSFENSSLPK